MKKEGIQTRKRKPKNPVKEGKSQKLSSSYSYLKDKATADAVAAAAVAAHQHDQRQESSAAGYQIEGERLDA